MYCGDFMNKEKEMRRLVIKTFHINKVLFNEKKTYIEDKKLYIKETVVKEAMESQELIKDLELNIINPNQHNIFVNSIMDFSPIATKVLGTIGEGITHVLTGVIVMLTGTYEDGTQVAEFGSSEGILKEQVKFGMAGTPEEDDVIIHVNVTLKKSPNQRLSPMAAHEVCDSIVQEIRTYLKNMNGNLCDEKYEYLDKIKPNKRKVVIIKQVAGQGAMYDTGILPVEPSGFKGSRSIIDLGNMPVVLSPNEYRDGALRAMN